MRGIILRTRLYCVVVDFLIVCVCVSVCLCVCVCVYVYAITWAILFRFLSYLHGWCRPGSYFLLFKSRSICEHMTELWSLLCIFAMCSLLIWLNIRIRQFVFVTLSVEHMGLDDVTIRLDLIIRELMVYRRKKYILLLSRQHLSFAISLDPSVLLRIIEIKVRGGGGEEKPFITHP